MAERMQDDKPSTTQIETIDDIGIINNPEQDANEEIVRHLQTTGEDVGFTFNTLMAAISMAMCYNAYLFTLLIPPAILTYVNADLGPDPRYTWTHDTSSK